MIAQLTQGSRLTRQAITKHLRVLESAGVVHGMRRGRVHLAIKRYIDSVSEQWEHALFRLKSFVEDGVVE